MGMRWREAGYGVQDQDQLMSLMDMRIGRYAIHCDTNAQ